MSYTRRDFRRIGNAYAKLAKRQRLADAYQFMLDNSEPIEVGITKKSQSTRGLFGRGSYSLGKAWRATVGKQGGRMLRQALLNKAVDTIAGSGAYTAGMYTGRGAYNNLLISGDGDTNSVPKIMGAGDETGGITIVHKEYVTDVYAPGVANGSAVPFLNQTFALNPGLSTSFPWLSQIAANYEEYEFVQMVWTWKSAISPTVSNQTGQIGTVVLVTNYNVNAKPFTEKASMLGYAHGFDVICTKDFDHYVECDPSKLAGDQVKLVRTAPIGVNEDLKNYDHGNFQFAMCNFNAALNATACGELWVEYTVRLSKPRLYVSLANNLQRDDYCSPTSQAKGLTGSNAAMFVATQPVYSNITNNLGTLLTLGGSSGASAGAGSSATLTFPASFVGAVRITIVTTYCGPYVSGTFRPAGLSGVGFTGNVTPIYDMFTQDGLPSWSVTPNVGTVSVGNDVAGEYHVYVRPATGNVNNSVRIDCLATDTGSSLSAWQILVQEYNSAGITLQTDRAVYSYGSSNYNAGQF